MPEQRPPLVADDAAIAPKPVDRPRAGRSSVLIAIERTTCFGFCPAYRLELDGDGIGTFTGAAFVAIAGPMVGSIGTDRVRDAATAIERLGFFDLQDSYDTDVTCMPTCNVEVDLGGRTKRVHEYARAGPSALTAVQKLIDGLGRNVQWRTPAGVDRAAYPWQISGWRPIHGELGSDVPADNGSASSPLA